MKAACIGDNCIDYYRNLERQYPTGNAVDTCVNMQKLGVPSAIISTTGSDDNGKWMIDSLKKEGLDISHLKVAEGQTAITYMDLEGLDRVHGEYEEGVLENIVFDEEDIRFACEHDIVHTALWGNAEKVLPAIHESGTLVSFDYCDRLDHPLVEQTIGCVDYGFFSYHGEKDDPKIREYLQDKVARGMKVATATFGVKGSLSWDGESWYDGGIYPCEKLVNTVGAGDSFIAGFLVGVLNGDPIDVCQDRGAKISSQVVGVFEPWVVEE
ncbi:fructoselysine 6-kinase [Atopobiaceae bacterium LCP21S3_F11]